MRTLWILVGSVLFVGVPWGFTSFSAVALQEEEGYSISRIGYFIPALAVAQLLTTAALGYAGNFIPHRLVLAAGQVNRAAVVGAGLQGGWGEGEGWGGLAEKGQEGKQVGSHCNLWQHLLSFQLQPFANPPLPILPATMAGYKACMAGGALLVALIPAYYSVVLGYFFFGVGYAVYTVIPYRQMALLLDGDAKAFSKWYTLFELSGGVLATGGACAKRRTLPMPVHCQPLQRWDPLAGWLAVDCQSSCRI